MSGVMLKPSGGESWLPGGGLRLPNGELWVPPESAEGISLERIVPRVCMVPDTFSHSAGQEAIELAEACGLILDPWEQLCLVLGMGQTKISRWAAFTVALIVARQNGKGSILEALELYWLFLGGEKLVGHSAHEYKTAMEAFRRLLWHIDSNDWLRKRVKKIVNTNGEEGIELISGQRLRFMARSKGAGRGFTFHKLVWDEGYALTREQQDAQLPTMSAVDNPQIWITSSPPLTSTTGEVLFQLRRVANALGVKLTFLDYGAEGSLDELTEIDLDDQDLWRMTNPSEVHAGSGHGVSIEYMEGERTNMSDEGFARERLCIWPADLAEGFAVITKVEWDRMCDPHSGSEEWIIPVPDDMLPHEADMFRLDLALKMGNTKPPTALVGLPVVSLDVSPRGAGRVSSSLGLASMRQDGKRHVELLATEGGSAWLIPALRTLLLRTPVGGIALDPGAPVGSLMGDLESLLIELGLPKELILRMAARDVASAFGMIYDAATESVPTVVHLDQLELSQALGGAMTREVGGTGGRTWDRRLSSADITSLNTITHALWGLAQPGLQQAESEPLVVWA